MRTTKATLAGPRHVKGLRGECAAKVSTRELEEQVLSPKETRINIVRSARQARNEKRKNVVSDLQTRRKMRSSSLVRRDGE